MTGADATAADLTGADLRGAAVEGLRARQARIIDADLSAVVRQLKRRGGNARLLAYKDGRSWHPVSSSDINQYVKERTGQDFTAKDFRTLRGTVAAAASLDVLHVSALVHDDVMDASDLRRGRPAAHRQFEALHAEAGWLGDSMTFGKAGAILLGDLLVMWSAQMLQAAGLDHSALQRALPIVEDFDGARRAAADALTGFRRQNEPFVAFAALTVGMLAMTAGDDDVARSHLVEVDELPDSERGAGGLGSSGS